MNYLFNPKSVALIGATDRPASVGRGLAKNLLQGKSSRKIYFVNPNRKKVLGLKTYSQVTDIKKAVALAIIAVPAKIVPKVIKQCTNKKVKAIIVISSGFKETGKKGKELEQKIKKLCQQADIDLIGPNCLGILRPSSRLNASFAPATPKAGKIALISQSGALLDSIIDATADSSYGFSAIISYGNEAGLKLTDFLSWADKDKKTQVIALYMEGLINGREFFNLAKNIKKPVVVLKGGKTKTAQKAVSTHTGALAGESQIYSAAFKQAGLIEVVSIGELLDVAKALAWQPKIKNGIGVVTNGGGAGILTADYCEKFGVKLTPLAPATKRKITKAKAMSLNWSKSNPADIVGDALADRYEVATEALLSQKNIYGLLVIQTMQIMTEPTKNAKIIIKAKKKWPDKAIVAVFMGEKLTKSAVNLLEKNKIPNYFDPNRAVRAMKALINDK